MGMHGDLVNGLCYTAFLPVYLWLWFSQPAPGAGLVNLFFLLVVVFSWLSWWYHHLMSSILASIATAGSIAAMNLYQWPHNGEAIIAPQFLWALVIASSNTPHSFAAKVGMAANYLLMALYVCVQSPLLQVSETLPTLLGATAFYLTFHYLAKMRPEVVTSEMHSALIASLVLATAFSYHMAVELFSMVHEPGYAMAGGYSILRAGFFAVVGLMAAGAFREQVDVKQALEALVKERTLEIKKQAEELRIVGLALQESETAIAIADTQGRLVWANTAFERLLRGPWKKEKTDLVDALTPYDRDLECLRRCFDQYGAQRCEIELQDRHFAVEVSPFIEDVSQDDRSRYLVVMKDVTDQRARERAEKLAEKEIMLKQVMQESMDALNHELRTPLQAVLGLASLLLENDDATIDEAKDSMSIIVASSRLLLTLINNLLDIRKCDAHMMDEFQLSPLSLESSMIDAANFCRPMAAITNVTVVLSMDPRRVQVMGNALRFQQVMINLVSNAVKYTKPGSSIQLETIVKSGDEVERAMDAAVVVAGAGSTKLDSSLHYAVVSVTDSGPGIAKEVAGRIFHPFSQVTTHRASVIGGNTVAQPSGTGLGLNLCLKFVKRMNGRIWVSATPHGGACFSFYLPVDSFGGDSVSLDSCSSIQLSPGSLLDLKEPKKGCPTDLHQYSVLVVDDTVINLKVLERMLRRLGVDHIMTVDSGSKALCALEKQHFDLVITDIQMPEMSGTELCHAIRCNENVIAKPIVVGLTAGTSESLQQRCADSGMPHVLHKPISAAEIRDFFDSVLGKLDPCDKYQPGS